MTWEAETNNFELDDSVSERRQRMLARLEARHVQQRSGTKAVVTEGADFEKLQIEATKLVNSLDARIDASFLRELENALTLMKPGRQSRLLRETLNMLRNRLQEQIGLGSQRTSFSFTAKEDANDSPQSTDQKTAATAFDPLGPSQTSVKPRKGKSIALTDKHNEELVVDGHDDEELTVNDVTGCVIRVPFRASTVHIKLVSDSTLIFAPVKTSLLIRNCENSTIVVAAQQIRIHDSHEMRLYTEVRGALIIEGCNGIEVAPYNVAGIHRDPQNCSWRNVQDFNWLSTEEQSPNWKIMTHDSTKCFTLQ